MTKNIIFVFLAIFFLLPSPLLAQEGLPIGSPCTSNTECRSGDCEESTIQDPQGNDLWFCDCKELDVSLYKDSSKSCSDEYGGKPAEWTCADGAAATYDLDYCQMNDGSGQNRTPLEELQKDDQSFFFKVMDYALDPDAAGIALSNEIQGIIAAPQPRITIPGLKFTDPKEVEKLIREEYDGNTYIYIPYIGEYLAAVYKYLVIVGSVLALVFIFKGGVQITRSAGKSESVEKGKTSITQAVIGLIILLTSYVILYTVNPELVQFRNLRLLYVKGETITDEGNPESRLPSNQGINISGSSLSGCNLSNLPTYFQKNQMFGKISGSCLGWVTQAMNNMCSAVPQILNANGAWDTAARFWQANQFHPCDLKGIKDGDIVFMTSMGSYWIGIWENFRMEPGTNCTIADASQKPMHYDKKLKKLVPAKVIEGNPPKGMPPVTHVGIYYN
ncbi:MAG: pilin, partial [Patescibacteria group bacterium]